MAPSSPSVTNSMLYSFLLFVITLSLQQMNREKLMSSDMFTIVGGFTSSLLFLLALTLFGNIQESLGSSRSGWGAVIVAEIIACIAAGTIHRVCVTTCFLFSMVLMYEVNKISTATTSAAATTAAELKTMKKVH